MDKKYGVFICTGCGIGDVLDAEALKAVAGEEGFPVQTHEFLCGKDGVALIQKEMQEKGINTMVIAACSRRVNFDIFRFDGCIVDRVNFREQVVWSHPRSDFPALTEEQKGDGEHFDRIQMLADDYLRMGMARVKKVTLPEPYKLENSSRKILVIGGGITGMSAALDAAKAGYEVTIVEQQPALGGYGAKIRKQLPVKEPYDGLIVPMVLDKIQEVEAETKITVKTQTEVARIAGQPGAFVVTLKKPGENTPFDVPFPLPAEMKVDESGKELDADKLREKYLEYNQGKEDILQFDPNGEMFGAVILAAGWRPDELGKEACAHLGYGAIADVVTNHQFEQIAAKGKIVKPSDGKEAKSVVFVQSPGKGESDNDFAYTGSVTSMVALKQAKYVRDDYNDGKAFVFYQHMRTPGLSENFYKSIQQDKGIFLTKGEVVSVSKNGT
ncbi:MAG: FAD-dependent oxidoreductase, partial [Proteobacteria bacterium]|nr:FAD-dependent oxidoreductase [Pseudomonadota bacterium]